MGVNKWNGDDHVGICLALIAYICLFQVFMVNYPSLILSCTQFQNGVLHYTMLLSGIRRFVRGFSERSPVAETSTD